MEFSTIAYTLSAVTGFCVGIAIMLAYYSNRTMAARNATWNAGYDAGKKDASFLITMADPASNDATVVKSEVVPVSDSDD